MGVIYSFHYLPDGAPVPESTGELIINMDYDFLRNKMVDEQLRDIKSETVLNAMRKVPRHLFIPENMQNRAYEDNPLPIGSEQTISQPYIVAYMTEQLEIFRGMKVLEIGTGSG